MKDVQTQAIHAGRPDPRIGRAIVTPVFQSSTYEYHGEGYHDVVYMRLNNTPNHQILAKRIAVLEGSEASIVTASGMAAISSVLFSLLSAGDHLLVQDCLYGGTHGLVNNELSRLGITHTIIDVQDPASWASSLQKTTRAIYVETLSNPLLQLADLEAIVSFSKEHGLIAIIDNTFASPVQCQPITLGFDIVVESCTKYMNGHNDMTAGCVAGSAELVRRVKRTLDHLGGTLDAHTCYLLERGLKTLGIRVAHQSQSATRIAESLSQHAAISKIYYPGLPAHPQHERAKRLLGGFGGMMSFELKGGLDAAEKFLGQIKIPAVAASFGGAESLIVRPAAAVHSGLTPEERARTGIADGLIRFSVGLEGTNDLLADLNSALDTVLD